MAAAERQVAHFASVTQHPLMLAHCVAADTQQQQQQQHA
jgi:hypothetical protein